MSGEVQVHVDQAWGAIRERPGTVVAFAAGGALVIGFWSGQWFAKYSSRRKSALLRKHLGENGGFDSGSTTPIISAGGTPRYSSTGDFDDRLDYSLALVYRADLGLSRGRFATLCAQATLGQFKKLWRAKNEDLKVWERNSAVKVCLQVEDEDQMLQIEQEAREADLPTFTVKDLQDNRRVRSVMAVGPAEISRIQKVTHSLRMLL